MYVDGILAEGDAHGTRLVAAVDPHAAGHPSAARLRAAGIPRYDTLREALARHQAALVVLATPIHLHAEDSVLALQHGANVLCEKPAAGCLADALAMVAAAKHRREFLAIGYQWSFSACIQAMKQRILSGEYGRPRRLATKVYWPRPLRYYTRNAWAGAERAADGRVINDSPVNNATAHYLHNMLFLLGGTPQTAAKVMGVSGRIYRAYPIKTFDSAALRVETGSGVPVFFYTSHAVTEAAGPVSVFEFESGCICFGGDGGNFRWIGSDGRNEDLGSPDAEGALAKLWQCADAIRLGRKPALEIAGAVAQTEVIEEIHRKAAEMLVTVPPERLKRVRIAEDDCQLEICGLREAFDRDFSRWSLSGSID